MQFESNWWSLDLPPEFSGEKLLGLYRVYHPEIPGYVDIECIQKDSGAPNDRDLQGHAGTDAEPRVIAPFRGFYSQDAFTHRWALRVQGKRRILLVRYQKHEGATADLRAIEVIIRSIRLK